MTTYKSLLQEVRSIKKLANDKYREKLISLLESGDTSFINQAISLNESLPKPVFTEDEIIDLLYKEGRYGWEEGSVNWFLLQEFPNASKWKTIKGLNLEGMGLTVPSAIDNLTNLEFLNLIENGLTSLPSEIGNLKNLDVLVLSVNRLRTLPKEIGKLTNLKVLSLQDNYLSSLPKEIGNLTNLKDLDLRLNNLSSLPSWIGNLTNLKELYLSYNNLSSLPSWIGNLKNLELLDLRNNNLSLEDVPSHLHKVTYI